MCNNDCVRFEAARDSRQKGVSKPVVFYQFDAEHGYAHIHIHTEQRLPEIVK